MSYCRKEGKDIIIFATEEDHKEPSKIVLPELEPQPGLIMPDGSINWNCPCLGGMAAGPCGMAFRDAFSCFHYSKEEPKGSDCFEAFRKMQECMSKYPTLYKTDDDDDEEHEQNSMFLTDETGNEALGSSTSPNSNDIQNSSSSSINSKSSSSKK